ncbi:alpha/beta fold hydrolase [Brevibacterium salitolerans]|uniref:Alpha/beta fold hydrolase n=1 Tax=Brevibacterium salitolerans TaxID=1403566 RepID=A0ABN2X2E6_9MICO
MAENTPGLRRLDRPVHAGRAGDAEPTDEDAGLRAGRGAGPSGADSAASAGPVFSLAYVRTRPEAPVPGRPPVVIVPGGPGLASAVPYTALRAQAAQRGLDVLMVEHRGVGLSRRMPDGEDLPLESMRITAVVDDLRAVLEAEGIGRALVVGSSYGTYVAQAFAHAHPELTAGLVLDSPMLKAGNGAEEEWATALLYDGTAGDDEHRRLAHKVRDLAAEAYGSEKPGELAALGRAVRIVYEFGGPEVLDAFLNQRKVGASRLVRRLLAAMGGGDTGTPVPYYMEFDRTGEIAFRELDYGGTGRRPGTAAVGAEAEGTEATRTAAGDGPASGTESVALAGPRRLFARSEDFAEVARQFSPFAGEPVDLEAVLPRMRIPVTVLSGDRDLRTPRPVAERITALVPEGVLVAVPDHGHSALDTHHAALLETLVAGADGKPGEIGTAEPGEPCRRRLHCLGSGGGPSAAVGPIIALTLALDRLLPRERR